MEKTRKETLKEKAKELLEKVSEIATLLLIVFVSWSMAIGSLKLIQVSPTLGIFMLGVCFVYFLITLMLFGKEVEDGEFRSMP